MATKTILRIGHPQLQVMAGAVKEFNTRALDNLIEDLFDTMISQNGVGIAATQIDIPLQVAVFGFEQSKRYPHAAPVPKTVLINPKIEILSDEINGDWEGCLSVRNHEGLRGLVPRHTHIKYSGYDAVGHFFEREVKGFHARLVQHEIDHLQGVLFVQRIEDLKYFGFESELGDCMQRIGSHLR